MKSPSRLARTAVALAGLVLGMTGAVALTTSATAATPLATGDHHECVTPVAGDFESTLTISKDGKTATAEVQLKGRKWFGGNGGLCATDITLVSYIAPAPSFAVPQYVFDKKTKHFDAQNSSYTWSVAVPACNTQVDLFLGSNVIDPLTEKGDRYNDKKLAWKNFGARTCVQPAVQAVTNCDGSTVLQLSNDGLLGDRADGYVADFVVAYGSTKKTVSVGPKKVEDVLVPAGSGTITVTAGDKGQANYVEKTFSWARPDTCKPSAGGKNDCKVVTITVSNPEKNVPVTADVTYNGTKKSVTVPAGQSTDVTFDAAKDIDTATIHYTAPTGLTDQTVTIVHGECATTPPTTTPTTPPTTESTGTPSGTPSATPSDSPSVTPSDSAVPTPSTSSPTAPLPVTGSSALPVAGGAVLLLLIGGALFLIARRRKVNFTA